MTDHRALAALLAAHGALLSERELRVMRLRFDPSRPRLLADVAAMVGCSRERVRQIEATSIQKLRAAGAPIDAALGRS